MVITPFTDTHSHMFCKKDIGLTEAEKHIWSEGKNMLNPWKGKLKLKNLVAVSPFPQAVEGSSSAKKITAFPNARGERHMPYFG